MGDVEQCRLWKQEWGGELYISCGDTKSRGVMILIHPKCEVRWTNITCDNEGRIVAGMVKLEKYNLLFCNIYTPNKDCPKFFTDLVQMLDNYTDSVGTVIGGDWNCVFNPELDRKQSLSNNDNAVDVIKEYMSRGAMVDVWRLLPSRN